MHAGSKAAKVDPLAVLTGTIRFRIGPVQEPSRRHFRMRQKVWMSMSVAAIRLIRSNSACVKGSVLSGVLSPIGFFSVRRATDSVHAAVFRPCFATVSLYPMTNIP
ncbi:hypothetical protein LJR235_002075 [Pararhizobium sp. LjRoot235]